MFFGFLFNWFETCNANSIAKQNRINGIFWFCLFFVITFHFFRKILQPHLRAAKLSYYKWDLTIRYLWNCCFYLVAVVFLYIYKTYFLADSLYFIKNGQNYLRSYENLLFYNSNNRCSLFNSINFILIAFYVIDVLYVLNERNISEAMNKFFACGIVICFDIYRLEYFSVMFNILLALIYLFNDGLRLICWHIPEKDDFAFRVCVSFKLVLWSFVFLNLLPFHFLIPTLFGRKFYIWLNSFFLLWYGACVWNSPILQYMYHQIYHTNNHSSECVGGSSVSRCILITETNELRHMRNIQRALCEIQFTDIAQKEETSSSMKTYQTIKCMIALKRKLKRIRENKESEPEST